MRKLFMIPTLASFAMVLAVAFSPHVASAADLEMRSSAGLMDAVVETAYVHDFFIFDERSPFIEPDGAETPIAAVTDPTPLAPVYELSRRTDGQSLSRYHMRC